MTLFESITIIGFSIGVISLGFALHSYYSSKKLAQSLTTRYLNDFPRSISDLLSFIKDNNRANRSEWFILTDCPGYGCVSQPESAKALCRAIGNLKIKTSGGEGDEIKIVFSPPDHRARQLERQFDTKEKWKDYKKKNATKIAHFIEVWKDEEDIQSLADVEPDTDLSWDQFKAITDEVDEHCLKTIMGIPSNRVRLAAKEIPLRFWLNETQHKAVFAYYFDEPYSNEQTFYTGDSKMTEAFRGIFESYWKSSVPWKKPGATG